MALDQICRNYRIKLADFPAKRIPVCMGSLIFRWSAQMCNHDIYSGSPSTKLCRGLCTSLHVCWQWWKPQMTGWQDRTLFALVELLRCLCHRADMPLYAGLASCLAFRDRVRWKLWGLSRLHSLWFYFWSSWIRRFWPQISRLLLLSHQSCYARFPEVRISPGKELPAFPY